MERILEHYNTVATLLTNNSIDTPIIIKIYNGQCSYKPTFLNWMHYYHRSIDYLQEKKANNHKNYLELKASA